jgi:hypothetical protein
MNENKERSLEMLKSFAVVCLLGLSSLGIFAQTDDLEDINFPLNSSIVVDGFQGLDMLAAVLAKHATLDLEATGWTDSQGTDAYNKKLSQRRAEAVKTYLVSKGADANRIKTKGNGVDSAHDNVSREGRFQNRHVALTVYETVNGNRQLVSYDRLLQLFFGERGAAMTGLHTEGGDGSHDKIMSKLTDLEKKIDEMGRDLQKRIADLEQSQSQYTKREDLPKAVSGHMQMGKYTGVSFGAGVDDEGDLTANVAGMYFRPWGEHFAIQLQGDVDHYEFREEGQADVGFIYQNKGFKLAAAGSYKWASLPGFDAARLAQGAVIADWMFGAGKIGLYGTVPLADGDVLRTVNSINSVYQTEYYVSVPSQVGLDFGISIGEKIDLGGHIANLDTEASDADLNAGLELQVNIKENFNWYLSADMNNSLLQGNDDSFQYLTGVRLGSWAKDRYKASGDITPVNIPDITYEILQRTVRVGNTAPTANAGNSRTNVPAGTVTLDGSGSTDPEGDALTYKWTQTGGPPVEVSGADSAMASFTGTAGESYTFQLTVRDNFGAQSTDSVSIGMEAAPLPDPVIISFVATPSTIDRGALSNLSWATAYGDTVTLSGVGEVGADGHLVISPATTTEYTLTVTNTVGTVSQSVTITVIQPPPIPAPVVNFFTAIPADILEGEFTTLSWSTTYAETVSITGLGQVNGSGSLVLAPTETTTYTITAVNENGTASADVTVTVTPLEPPNTAPVAEAGTDVSVTTGTLVTLDGSASFDPDGDAITYQWTQLDGEVVALSGATTANPSFTAINGRYVFRLKVTDTHGTWDVDNVEVVVKKFKR